MSACTRAGPRVQIGVPCAGIAAQPVALPQSATAHASLRDVLLLCVYTGQDAATVAGSARQLLFGALCQATLERQGHIKGH